MPLSSSPWQQSPPWKRLRTTTPLCLLWTSRQTNIRSNTLSRSCMTLMLLKSTLSSGRNLWKQMCWMSSGQFVVLYRFYWRHSFNPSFAFVQAWWWEEGIRSSGSRLRCVGCCKQGEFGYLLWFEFLNLLLSSKIAFKSYQTCAKDVNFN